jgi:hypothetical protein
MNARRSAELRPCLALVPLAPAALAATLLAGCAGSNFKLPLLPASAIPSEASSSLPPSGPQESALTVPGTPTGVFAQVARGALGCWLAADGPLKPSHVYRAEADPPSQGGAAEIVLYERDVSVRDQRGPQAYRIAFRSEIGGVRVVATALKFEPPKAQAMARDVETWAKGSQGCQLRTVMPPPAPPKTPAKLAKGSAPNKSAANKKP